MNKRSYGINISSRCEWEKNQSQMIRINEIDKNASYV